MTLTINNQFIPFESLVSASSIILDSSDSFREKIKSAQDLLLKEISEGKPIYGVTTGYGESGKNYLVYEDAVKLQNNLYRFHGCGVGDILSEQEIYYIMLVRLISISKGFSGVSVELLESLISFLEHGIYPAIPSKGSVGASGDLTPLSYIAAALVGDREVIYKSEIRPTSEVLKECGIKPYSFKPKEALAIMNGTSVMTGILVLQLQHFEKLLMQLESFASCLFEAMEADTTALEPFVHNVKPFDGQIKSAKNILAKTSGNSLTHDRLSRYKSFFDVENHNIQDRYSIRCVPQVLGVAWDNLAIAKKWVETEINSVSDNPLMNCDEQIIYTGCNFYGGYMAHAADTLKICLANMADLLDKQFAVLVDEKFNRGLGENLKLSKEHYHHGFKAMQISLSSLSADVMMRMLPSSVFSRSTESMNQDKVSMGTTGALGLKGGIEEFSSMMAIAMLGMAQAIDIRGVDKFSPFAQSIYDKIRKISPPLIEDRRLDMDILKVKDMLLRGDLI
ncbi:MAG: aromatic amino acid ammonia-lyase [Sulfurovaceae bacterium]|nr:aromatic amino acid ammonia-lyase [Sulfurovaceae bacterium]